MLRPIQWYKRCVHRADGGTSHHRLVEKWFDIFLESLAIIQGLAFGYLAQHTESVIAATTKEDPRPVVHFSICAVLAMRVFQTYITAIVDNQQWFRLLDAPLLCVIGVLEYLLFSTFDSLGSATTPQSQQPAHAFDYGAFYFRFSLVCLLGIIGHSRALQRINAAACDDPQVKKDEASLQKLNLAVLCLLVFGTVILGAWHERTHIDDASKTLPYASSAIVAAMSAVLALNMYVSFRVTFGRDPQMRMQSTDHSRSSTK